MALSGSTRNFHASVAVSDSSQVGEARRSVELEARAAGFAEMQRARLAIIATEIATNIARHTRGGELLYRVLPLPAGSAIEVLGVDRGPGMVDSTRCMVDGYSTASTPGNGLGAIRRQADEFDLYSTVDRGTVIFARVYGGKVDKGAIRNGVRFGGVSTPHPGEPLCGDAWRLCWNAGQFALLVSDGLGHGLKAHEASQAAIELFEEAPFLSLPDLLGRVNRRLHGTRGGTVAVASFDALREQLSYIGIGNICGRLLSGAQTRGLISQNGTVGAYTGKFQQYDYEWPMDTTLVMHSDGIQSRWESHPYPGLMLHHPAVIAGTLYRDYQRGRDDVSIVVAQWVAKPKDRGQ